jgi:tetratricopeptide (TPR) repeat protein/DNA-binding MarR family transcriptional regulator
MGGQTYLPIEILDYVETHAPSSDAPYGISQRELAKALGYHPCSMSRPLATLVEDGYLASARGLVRDGLRKQLTYRLTTEGRTRLRRETRDVPLMTGEVPPPPHPFLGRKDELDRLLEFAREEGSITLVDGAPGMGKTALLSRHLRQTKRGRVPFWFTVRLASSPRNFVTVLSHAVSSLGSPQLAYYSQLPRNPVAREVADLAARALGTRSLVGVVDDFQVAGPDLRKFLVDFIAALAKSGGHSFYVVGQDVPDIEIAGVATRRLTVGGLDRASAHELTDRQGGLADRFESVYQSTLGSPLMLQLAVLNPEIHADAATLPVAVVKRLTQHELEAVLPAAFATEPLPSTFLTDEEGLPPARFSELCRMGILHKTLQDRVEILQVVRNALLSRITNADERKAHLDLARFYGRSHRPEAIRERFLHLVEGEDWKTASRLLEDHERVLLRLGYSESLRMALRHLSTALSPGPSKVKVLLTEAELLRHHSDYLEAVACLRRAITEANDDKRIICEARLSITELLVRLTQVEEARKEFEAAQTIGASTRRLQSYFTLTEARFEEAKGDTHSAADLYQKAFEQSRRCRATDLALESIAAWSRIAELTSGPDTALRMIKEALPDARQTGRMDLVFNLLLVRARAFSEMNQGALAESEMKAIRSEAESLGYLTQLTYTLSGLAAVAIENSRWAEGTAYAKQASTLAERLGNDVVLGHTLALLCTSELRQWGLTHEPVLIDEAFAHGSRSVEVLDRIAPSDSLVLAHSYLSEVHLARNELPEARVHFASALQVADKLRLGWLRQRLIEEIQPKLGEGEAAGPASGTPPAEPVVENS